MIIDYWVSTKNITGLITVDDMTGNIIKTPPVWKKWIGTNWTLFLTSIQKYNLRVEII